MKKNIDTLTGSMSNRANVAKPVFCEHSRSLNGIYVCKLTSFGFVFRCLTSDKKSCPDLDFFKERGA